MSCDTFTNFIYLFIHYATQIFLLKYSFVQHCFFFIPIYRQKPYKKANWEFNDKATVIIYLSSNFTTFRTCEIFTNKHLTAMTNLQFSNSQFTPTLFNIMSTWTQQPLLASFNYRTISCLYLLYSFSAFHSLLSHLSVLPHQLIICLLVVALDPGLDRSVRGSQIPHPLVSPAKHIFEHHHFR